MFPAGGRVLRCERVRMVFELLEESLPHLQRVTATSLRERTVCISPGIQLVLSCRPPRLPAAHPSPVVHVNARANIDANAREKYLHTYIQRACTLSVHQHAGRGLLVLGGDRLQALDRQSAIRPETVSSVRGRHALPHGLGLQQVQCALLPPVTIQERACFISKSGRRRG